MTLENRRWPFLQLEPLHPNEIQNYKKYLLNKSNCQFIFDSCLYSLFFRLLTDAFYSIFIFCALSFVSNIADPLY